MFLRNFQDDLEYRNRQQLKFLSLTFSSIKPLLSSDDAVQFPRGENFAIIESRKRRIFSDALYERISQPESYQRKIPKYHTGGYTVFVQLSFETSQNRSEKRTLQSHV